MIFILKPIQMLKLNLILRYTKEWCYNYNLVYPFTFYERGRGNRILKKLRQQYYNEYKNEIQNQDNQ